MRNLGRVIVKVQKNVTKHLVKCIHQAAKEALGEKILRSKTKPFYYWIEENGQLIKKRKIY